ncbi:hypothetical protein T4E_2777 [Trichinella pseudospiralis]|uniref:Uncharacterized protein n=1 Tax=Trichinella pseudospiralis TaxID=6337 RepID=A0A0V0XH20_TRIPS|nr:hypothetical protein T4E_2777 [Trichinella pseudospiralis]
MFRVKIKSETVGHRITNASNKVNIRTRHPETLFRSDVWKKNCLAGLERAVHICRPGRTKQAFCFAYSLLGEERALAKKAKTKTDKGHTGQF